MANGKMFLALCFFDTSIFIRAEKKKLLKGSIFDETTLTSGNCFDNFGHSNEPHRADMLIRVSNVVEFPGAGHGTLQMFCLLNPQMNVCEPNPNSTCSDFHVLALFKFLDKNMKQFRLGLNVTQEPSV